VPAGIWQPAYLVQLARSDIHVRNVLVDVYRRDQVPLLPPDQSRPWVVSASIDFIGSLPLGSTLDYELKTLQGKSVLKGSLSNVTTSAHTISGSVIVPDKLVELWWPTGMGSQKLYSLHVHVKSQDGTTSVTSVDRRIGFRTILLNQEPVRPDQLKKGVAPGSNWHFEINGEEFYAKGSNFIPPDTFWTRVTREKMEKLFYAVQKGNQNMLRVWSSGAYLPDFIYEIADELGILLWSEFQFGDALYPVDKDFLDNVREEAHYQVRRINHHPSLALWAGGNELENLELNMIRGHPDFNRYLAEYEMLFLDVLAPAVFENSRSISYTPSSTSNGWLKLDFTKKQPISQRYYNTSSSEIYGNTDYYNYNSAVAFQWGNYPVGRFSNEFGFHSMPSIQTWRQAVDEKDLTLQSEVVRLRNRHYPPGGLDKNFEASDNGMDEMVTAVHLYYPAPDKINPAANFSAWCHATQIFQADFYSSQIQFYRRGSGMPERQLGSLYWQLEDIWQAPTWAGIEYGGRWKVLHYIAKDRYKNVIISPFFDPDTGRLEIYATSDLFDSVKANATFTWYDWSGKPLKTATTIDAKNSFEIGAINTTKVAAWKIDEALKGIDNSSVVLKMDIIAVGNLPNSKKEQVFTHQNWYHPVPLSKVKLEDPGLKITHNAEKKVFRIEATKAIAPWVWIDYPAGAVVTFEDNGFWLKPGDSRDLTYEVQSDETAGKWATGVTVESLWNMTLR
jgi:beta-mannosidase